MQLGSIFISNCNITLHVSDAFCIHPQQHLKTVVTASGVDRAATGIGSFLISATQIIREEVPMEANICNRFNQKPISAMMSRLTSVL